MQPLHAFPVKHDTIQAIEGPPSGFIPVSGDPIARTVKSYVSDNGKVIAGYWECSDGTFDATFEKWEFCYIIEGEVILRQDGLPDQVYKKSDSFIVEPGFKGIWTNVGNVRKYFTVILS